MSKRSKTQKAAPMGVKDQPPAAPKRVPDPKNLETLALFISSPVRTALHAAYIQSYARLYFYQYNKETQHTLFSQHPANTLTYQALGALEDQCIVSIFETLRDKHGLYPHNEKIRRKEDIYLHRLALSHPADVIWDKLAMQDFHESGRQHTDFRAALVWDLQRSVNEALAPLGLRTFNESISVYPEMAASLHLILTTAAKEASFVPPSNELLAMLAKNLAEFQALLESNPDGARDLEAEKEQQQNLRNRLGLLKESGNEKA